MKTSTKIIIAIGVVGAGVGAYFVGKSKGWFGKKGGGETDGGVVTDGTNNSDSTSTVTQTVTDSTSNAYVPKGTTNNTPYTGEKTSKGNVLSRALTKLENFSKVPVFLGSKAKLEGDVYYVSFNTSKQVSTYGIMKAQFYNNNRIFIFDVAGKNIAKGNYYNGGKKIVITDGKNKGKTIESGSVWTNLLNILR